MSSLVPRNDIKKYLLQAGEILRKYQDRHLYVSSKEDSSPVTQADQEVDDFLRSKLMPLLPNAGWLSEESKDSKDRLNCSWTWVVDPLDGTKEFIHKVPEFCVSIGLVHNGDPVLGAVYNPVSGEGAIGEVGAYFDSWGESAVSKDSINQIPVSRTEFPHKDMQEILSSGLDIVPVGSVAYKLLRVAMGTSLATFTLVPKSEWDICGGVALLYSRGFEYRRFDGKKIIFNNEDVLIRCGSIAGSKAAIDNVSAKISKYLLSQ